MGASQGKSNKPKPTPKGVVRRCNQRNHGIPGALNGRKRDSGLFQGAYSKYHNMTGQDPAAVVAYFAGGSLAQINARLRNHRRWAVTKRFRLFA